LSWQDQRVFRQIPGDRLVPFYYYYAQPVLSIYVTMKDTEQAQLYLFEALPDMVYGYAPVTDALPNHADFRFVGEFRGSEEPASLKWVDRAYPRAFQVWLSGEGPGRFSADCSRGWKDANGERHRETIEADGGIVRMLDPNLPTYVEQELDKHRHLISLMVLREASTESRLKTTISALSGTKRLLEAFLRIFFPVSFRSNMRLASVALRELQVYADDFEWESLTEAIEQRAGFRNTWMTQRWFQWAPAPYRPGEVPPPDRIVQGCVEELAVMGQGTLDSSSTIGRRLNELQSAILYEGLTREDDPVIAVTLEALRRAQPRMR